MSDKNKDKKDVENYTKPRDARTGGVVKNRMLSADDVSRATMDEGRMTGKTKDKAYQMSYINKGKKASKSAQADKMDAKASALAMMKMKAARKKEGKSGLFMYEPDAAEAKRINARNKRYR